MSKFVLVYGVLGGHFVHVSTLHRECVTSSLIKGTQIKVIIIVFFKEAMKIEL